MLLYATVAKNRPCNLVKGQVNKSTTLYTEQQWKLKTL